MAMQQFSGQIVSLVDRYKFPLKMFLLSRLLIFFAMLIVAPFFQAPPGGVAASFSWDVFHAWDSEHYESIIKTGYEFVNDEGKYNVVFPPLFSLLAGLLMSIGLPFNQAGTLVNNAGFLIALILLYEWISSKHDLKIAEFSVMILAWFPLSLYGSVIYTEGIFLLFSIAALYFFDQKSYILAGIMGGLTTATRIIGLALVPAFWLATWLQKRDLKGYAAGIITCTGFWGYLGYFWLKFNDPLIFLQAQKNYYPDHLFWGQGWLDSITLVLFGNRIIADGFGINYSYVLPLVTIAAVVGILYLNKEKIGDVALFYTYAVLWIVVWLIGGDPLLDMVISFGSLVLFWQTKEKIGLVNLIYVACCFLIILSTGRPGSVERYVYAIAPLSLSLSFVLIKRPRLTRFLMLFFGLTLGIFSIHFSQNLWIA